MALRVVVRELGTDLPSGISRLRVEPEGPGTVGGSSADAAAALASDAVLVRIRAAAVNFPDLLMTCGAYQYKPQLPYTPGTEAAGVVVRCGEAVRHLAVGDRVVCGARDGMMRAFATVPARSCFALPPGFSFEEGASFNVAYSTAYHCLIERAKLESGDAVLINGATGGVGMAAVQIASVVGCRTIIATGTSSSKLAAVRATGATAVVDLAETPLSQLPEVVKRLTGGHGADVVYDPVGGELFDQSLRASAWGARVAVVGFAGGDNSRAVRANYALIKGLTILGCRAGESVVRGKVDQAARMTQLLGWAAEGKLRPYVSHRFHASEARQAFEALCERKVVGKAVVVFDGSSAEDSEGGGSCDGTSGSRSSVDRGSRL